MSQPAFLHKASPGILDKMPATPSTPSTATETSRDWGHTGVLRRSAAWLTSWCFALLAAQLLSSYANQLHTARSFQAQLLALALRCAAVLPALVLLGFVAWRIHAGRSRS